MKISHKYSFKLKYFKIGDAKLGSEFSREEILKDFVKLNNVDDLFNSDILILPLNKGRAFEDDQLDIKKEYQNINIKYYAENQENLTCHFTAAYSPQDIIELGPIIISTISGLITIGEYIIKKCVSNDTNHTIKIQLYNKNINNNYNVHIYEGDVYNYCTNEIERMKEDFKKE